MSGRKTLRAALLASTAMLPAGAAVAQTVTISPGQSIQAAVDGAPAGTTFNLSAGTFSGQQFQAKSNDQFIGAANGGTILNGNGMGSPMVTAGNGATGVVLKDLSVTNYQTGAQEAPIHTGAGWSVINVTSTGNGAAGLYVSGANVLVQGGSYGNNGQEGIAGSQANGSKILDTTISNNNTKGFDPGWEAGGLKITATDGITISGNTVTNNAGPGIWGDEHDNDWLVTGNGAANNAGPGIMYEISHNATITGNLVANNGSSQIYVSNSDGTVVRDNGVETIPGSTIHGAAEGGGIVLWTNSGRGNDPNTGQPYLSNNDTAENNTIVGPQSTSGIFSVLGTPSNDTFVNNIFEAAGAAGEAAAQAAVQAAQAAAKAVAGIAGTVTAAVGPVLKTLSAPVSAPPAGLGLPQTASASFTAPETSIAGPAYAAPPQESTPPAAIPAPIAASTLPDPPALPAGMTTPAGYSSGSADDPPVSQQSADLVNQGNQLRQQSDAVLAGVLSLMPPPGGR